MRGIGSCVHSRRFQLDQQISVALSVAEKIRSRMFPSANSFLLAGSVVRGEATVTSDLDLIVVFNRVEHATRQSFLFADWPVEAFIHDPHTLMYFFDEVDRPTGVPSLANMVSEGIEVPGKTELGMLIKDLADQNIEAGPVPWGQQERDNSRYFISEMIEDIRAPRTPDELYPVVADLYTAVADHFCRSKNQWSAKGKSIPRRLKSLDPVFCRRFTDVFAAAFAKDDTAGVIQLCEDVLQPDGGLFFDGYNRDAPSNWRTTE
ncbi:MAG: nucleotidyltransferase domain-containing protein [Pseudomonadota bacterium]